jgi:threonine aldolase
MLFIKRQRSFIVCAYRCDGNQLAIKCHTNPGDEVIVESESHILNYETAGPSVISSVQLLPVKGFDGYNECC